MTEMATCRECLHFDVCIHRYRMLCEHTELENANHACAKFKDRNRFVETVHGRWNWKDGKCFCSVCFEQGEPKFVYQDGTVDEHPYCSSCGAKMTLDKSI